MLCAVSDDGTRPVIVVRSSVQKRQRPQDATVHASIAQRLLVLFWHRVERLAAARSSRSGRIDGRPSRPSSNGPKRLGVAQPFWCVGSGSGSCHSASAGRGGAETLKEPLITWDGCRVLDTRSHDDHWTKCLHPQTPYSSRFFL